MEASLPLSLARPDVREAQRRRLSVLPELHAGRKARWKDRLSAARRDLERRRNAADARAARIRPRRRDRYLLALLHHDPPSGAGGRQPDLSRQNSSPAVAGGRTASLL